MCYNTLLKKGEFAMDELYDVEFYKKFRAFVVWFMNAFYTINAEGLENIPDDESYILAGNHLNILDSWLLLALIDENLRFMVDKKLYRYKSWEKFFRMIGTFPIDPNNLDIGAVKNVLALIKMQEKVVIFPEGKTHKITASVPFKPGVAKISVLANSQIVPFGISGSYKPFSTLNINFGEPINFKQSGLKRNEYDEYLESTVRKLERR